MNGMTKLLRSSPRIFYVAAVAAFIIRTALPIHDLMHYGYAHDFPTEPGQLQSAIIRLVTQEAVNSLYILANGLVIQTLIAIWDKLPKRSDPPS
jgi:hypothetical protein